MIDIFLMDSLRINSNVYLQKKKEKKGKEKKRNIDELHILHMKYDVCGFNNR